jgi:stress-induced morphogen
MTPEQIKNRLLETYSDAHVEVTDLTGTLDHYQVVIRTNALKGMTRINQHKAVMSVFDQELKTGEIHAFTLKTSALE